MTAEWAELDERGWQVYGGLHRLLLRLAGRLPDEVITRARTMLATGDLSYLPDTITLAAAESGVALAPGEAALLRETFVALGIEGEPAALDQIRLEDGTPGTGHSFAPERAEPPRVPPGADLSDGVPDELADVEDDLFDLEDHLVTDALSDHAETAAVWRAWRSGPGDRQRVYLAQVDPGTRAWELTLEAQEELSRMGQADPQVEVYWEESDLAPYQREARASAALLWRRP